MLWDLVNLDKLRRGIIYAAYMLIVLMLQNAVLSRVALFGAKAMIVPAAVVAVGMFEGGVWGAMFGLVTGLLADKALGYTALLTALFPVIGFFSGVLSRYFVNKRFFAYMIVSAAAFILTAFCQMFPLWVFRGQDVGVLFYTAVMQVLLSLPLAIPLYFPGKALSRRRLG
ncbi:MAG: hypothetical protein EOM54_00830 [Clostridia bacterium]|nr:hypothetical protein [Clostridia bacterium]NCC68999.1 hypothetical protein [Clostridia bacterium]